MALRKWSITAFTKKATQWKNLRSIQRLEGKKTGANPKVPYFGAGHPGVYWLNARTESTYNSDCLGLSSFEWIGNWYKAIGIEAHPATKKWWERLK